MFSYQFISNTLFFYKICDRINVYNYNFIEEVPGMGEIYNDNWISIEDASIYLGVSKDTVRNWIKKTDIPAHKIGKAWKFKKSELDEWIKSGRSAI